MGVTGGWWEALDVSQDMKKMHLCSGVSWIKGRIKCVTEEAAEPSNF